MDRDRRTGTGGQGTGTGGQGTGTEKGIFQAPDKPNGISSLS